LVLLLKVFRPLLFSLPASRLLAFLLWASWPLVFGLLVLGCWCLAYWFLQLAAGVFVIVSLLGGFSP
jgi:hypothetical protein